MPYADKEKQRVALVSISRRRRKRLREILNRIKDVPCMDCKHKFPPVCMDFDHPNPTSKLFDVGGLRKGLSVILEEAAKCDIVCSNCHRIRTLKRGQYTGL